MNQMDIANEKPLKVIYIMGAGHSGSTVLDTILGNYPEAEGVGELHTLVRGAWKQGWPCACGAAGDQCPFWAEVREEWVRRCKIGDLESSYSHLQENFERLKRLLRLRAERRKPSPEFEEYARQTCALYEAIQAVSHKSVIVDSSKHPVRAYALSLIPQIDLRLIHLVRDGRGVVWSMKKSYKRNLEAGIAMDIEPTPVWITTFSWCFGNLLSEWVRKQLPPQKSMRVRYEDLVAKPRETLQSIGTLIGCDMTELSNIVAEGGAVKSRHLVAGNYLKMAGNIRLRADTDWMQKLPVRDQRMFKMFAGWLMRRYGYN